MAQDSIAFLERVVGGPAHLVGCSAGASVALLVALRRPDLARRVVLVSGVFHRDGWVPGAIDPDASPPEVLVRGYAELSPDGPGHFPVVNAKLARMNWEEPTLAACDLSAVTSRTLVMIGDDDEVTLEHAIAMYRRLPDAELAVVTRYLARAPSRDAGAVQRDHRRLPAHRPRAHDRPGPPRERSVRMRSGRAGHGDVCVTPHGLCGAGRSFRLVLALWCHRHVIDQRRGVVA